MDVPLTKYVTKLNKLSYKNQCMHITKKLISMEPDDITYYISVIIMYYNIL